jgi:HemY protein
MLWSLIKILAFVAAITALTFGATQLMQMEGGATLSDGSSEIQLGVLELAFALVALVVLVWLGLKLIKFLIAGFKFLNGDETAISRYFDRNREKKGYEALSEGMMALASGEGHLAMAKANRAERYLDEPQLTTLLAAQAAEMVGDRGKAEPAYRKLVENDKTRFVGVRGIMKQKLAEGDKKTAKALASRAFALKPKHEETQDVLLKLQAHEEDWSGARETLNAKLKSGALPRDVHKRRDAVLALSSARNLPENDSKREELAIEANRLSPDLVPAAIMAAKDYIAKGNVKAASKVLSKAWGSAPHPDLAASFAEIVPDETPEARVKRFRVLTKQNPKHQETLLLLTELHLAAKDFAAARVAIGDLVESDPTARSLALMAAIERAEGADESVVRGFLTKALSATRGEQWVCGNCHGLHANWEPVCVNCEAFDSLTWERPTISEGGSPNRAEVLPLLEVADPEDVSEEASEPT